MNHPSLSLAVVAAGSAIAGGMFAAGQIAANPSSPIGYLAGLLSVAAVWIVVDQARRVR